MEKVEIQVEKVEKVEEVQAVVETPKEYSCRNCRKIIFNES